MKTKQAKYTVAILRISNGTPTYDAFLRVNNLAQAPSDTGAIIFLSDSRRRSLDKDALERMAPGLSGDVTVKGTMTSGRLRSPDGKEWIWGPAKVPGVFVSTVVEGKATVIEVSEIAPHRPE